MTPKQAAEVWERIRAIEAALVALQQALGKVKVTK